MVGTEWKEESEFYRMQTLGLGRGCDWGFGWEEAEFKQDEQDLRRDEQDGIFVLRLLARMVGDRGGGWVFGAGLCGGV
jgi:hypothetical protein